MLPQGIILIDSVAHADISHKESIIVCGSHGGESAARYLFQFSPGGAIFNDAGKGKDDAGISGLKLLQSYLVPAATVDTFSAVIGDSKDTYESGRISAVNDEASKCGIVIGMHAKEAANKMLCALKNNREL